MIKLEMGLQELAVSGSNVGFSRRGVSRRACFRLAGRIPCSALEVDNFMRYINLLTYLLTYMVKGEVACTDGIILERVSG